MRLAGSRRGAAGRGVIAFADERRFAPAVRQWHDDHCGPARDYAAAKRRAS